MSLRRIAACCGVAVVAVTAVTACGRGKAAVASEALLDALRAEDREQGLSYAESQGKRLFDAYCVTCHGDRGQGDGQNASNLVPPPPDLMTSKNMADAAYVRKVIAQGSAAAGRSPLSPPYDRSLTAGQIDYLTQYCRALGRPKPVVAPASPQK